MADGIASGDPQYPERTILGAFPSLDGVCQARTGPGTDRAPTWAFADGSRGASPSTPYAAPDQQGDFQSAPHLGANRQVPCITYPDQVRSCRQARLVP